MDQTIASWYDRDGRLQISLYKDPEQAEKARSHLESVGCTGFETGKEASLRPLRKEVM